MSDQPYPPLLDYFAAAALQGALAYRGWPPDEQYPVLADLAYKMASQMIQARQRKDKDNEL